LLTAGQKFPRSLEGYLKFFAIFQNLHTFIRRFLAGPLMMFRAILGGKHCSIVTSLPLKNDRQKRVLINALSDILVRYQRMNDTQSF
jgi:hypothetical protein